MSPGPAVESQDHVVGLFARLLSTDWPTVRKAKHELVNLQETVIPSLLTLLAEDKYVKLQNTGSLQYPGATQFDRRYPGGKIQSVDYDIDWIRVRAGWVLEELTFQAFGFSQPEAVSEWWRLFNAAGVDDLKPEEVLDLIRDTDSKREGRKRAAESAVS